MYEMSTTAHFFKDNPWFANKSSLQMADTPSFLLKKLLV